MVRVWSSWVFVAVACSSPHSEPPPVPRATEGSESASEVGVAEAEEAPCPTSEECWQRSLAHDDRREYEQARVTAEHACNLGNDSACRNFGLYLARGDGGAAEPRRGAALVSRACEADNIGACTVLGIFLENGIGMPQDLPRARRLHQRACEAGSRDSCLNLGAMLSNGDGGPQDRTRALAYFERACEGGSETGCRNVEQLDVSTATSTSDQETGTDSEVDGSATSGANWPVTMTDMTVDNNRFSRIGATCGPFRLVPILQAVASGVGGCERRAGTTFEVTVDSGRVTAVSADGDGRRCVEQAVRRTSFGSATCRLEATFG